MKSRPDSLADALPHRAKAPRRTVKVEWSHFAYNDRCEIFDYIELDNPTAAADVDERIRLAIEPLAQFPEIGRIGRVEGTRELGISGTPYIAVYQRNADGLCGCSESFTEPAVARESHRDALI